MAGVYVHFPFCAAKCIYCDFYARVRRDWTPYVEALIGELAERKEFLQGVPPTTLYFGGGTPSLLPP
ncbi:MAG: coproporphyrinogen III oxidase, partial [Bacteroidales bacterium]|nr:coproporphyrinogen III oxidase [Bacteroidales bacterium]